MRTFSSTVAPGRMLVIWYERAMALREIRFGGSPAMSSPANRMRPALGCSTPVTQLKNVDLPAPLGPMMARISPAGTAMLTSLSAVRPPNRMVSFSVRRRGAAPAPATGAARSICVPVTLDELAGGRHDRLLFRDRLDDVVLAVLDVEDELADERLVVLFPHGLVALREVVAFLHLQALESFDELHRVLVASEAALLHADLERVYRLEVRLHVAIRQGARRVDLLERRHRLVEELLVRRRVQRRVEHGDVPVDADESLDLLAEGGQVGRLRDRAVARELVLLGQAEVVGLAGHDDTVCAEEDAEQPVEVAGDLREECRHVRGPERNAGAADDLAPGLLDLLDVGVTGGLAPGVVEIRDVPLLAHLVDQIRREGHGLGGRVVEGPEHVAAALGRGDGRVETDADHPDGLVLLEDRHAGQTHVGEIAALGEVDLVLDDELLGLAPAHVRLRLVVGDHQLDRAAVDPARLVDAFGRHLRADQRRLAAGGGDAAERLGNADLVRLGLAERLAPGRRYQHGGADGPPRGGGQTEEPTPGGLAAPPQIPCPGLVLPAFSHRSSSSEVPTRGAMGVPRKVSLSTLTCRTPQEVPAPRHALPRQPGGFERPRDRLALGVTHRCERRTHVSRRDPAENDERLLHPVVHVDERRRVEHGDERVEPVVDPPRALDVTLLARLEQLGLGIGRHAAHAP